MVRRLAIWWSLAKSSKSGSAGSMDAGSWWGAAPAPATWGPAPTWAAPAPAPATWAAPATWSAPPSPRRNWRMQGYLDANS